MKVALISTYDLGHQPFGLASPSAWLRERGAEVLCIDLSLGDLDQANTNFIRHADAVAFYLPMHTATRIAATVIEKVRSLNPSAQLCAYGLYAPMNASYLRSIGVDAIFAGEFEEQLTDAIMNGKNYEGHDRLTPSQIPKLKFRVPDRALLPGLEKYAFLTLPDGTRRKVGYTEASRGCKHLCRHCPIVPVYDGQFRIVQTEVVLADLRQLISAGAEHISFGDPDFFNGPRHAMEIVEALNRNHARITYDATIKVEHLIKHAQLLPTLRDTGCLFVTSAVESVNDRTLELLRKGHARSDFFQVVDLFRETNLTLSPTFVAFTPWTSLEDYRDLLECIANLSLIENVAPVQLAIRLLIPRGSRILDVEGIDDFISSFDDESLCYRWRHPDPQVDRLQQDVETTIKKALSCCDKGERSAVFRSVWRTLQRYLDIPDLKDDTAASCCSIKPVPQFSEAWYCCAEPMDHQMRAI